MRISSAEIVECCVFHSKPSELVKCPLTAEWFKTTLMGVRWLMRVLIWVGGVECCVCVCALRDEIKFTSPFCVSFSRRIRYEARGTYVARPCCQNKTPCRGRVRWGVFRVVYGAWAAKWSQSVLCYYPCCSHSCREGSVRTEILGPGAVAAMFSGCFDVGFASRRWGC